MNYYVVISFGSFGASTFLIEQAEYLEKQHYVALGAASQGEDITNIFEVTGHFPEEKLRGHKVTVGTGRNVFEYLYDKGVEAEARQKEATKARLVNAIEHLLVVNINGAGYTAKLYSTGEERNSRLMQLYSDMETTGKEPVVVVFVRKKDQRVKHVALVPKEALPNANTIFVDAVAEYYGLDETVKDVVSDVYKRDG